MRRVRCIFRWHFCIIEELQAEYGEAVSCDGRLLNRAGGISVPGVAFEERRLLATVAVWVVTVVVLVLGAVVVVVRGWSRLGFRSHSWLQLRLLCLNGLWVGSTFVAMLVGCARVGFYDHPYFTHQLPTHRVDEFHVSQTRYP